MITIQDNDYKGKVCSIKEVSERELLTKAIENTVDNLKKLKKIIVYSVLIDDEKTKDLFKYASNRGIEIVVPNNVLKERNKALSEAVPNGKD